jgi:hypothetical protein
MKRSGAWGNAALALSLLLWLPGCHNRPAPTGSVPLPAGGPGTVDAARPQPPGTEPALPGKQAAVPLNPSKDLRYLGLYLQNHGKNGRSPSKLDELADMKRDLPQVYRAVQDGAYVVYWNAPLTPVEAIVAYERDAPTKGGTVLAADGSVSHLTAEEFRAAPKAGK